MRMSFGCLQFVKCGYAGSNFPSHIFPSLVGRPIIRSSAKVEGIEIKVRDPAYTQLLVCCKLFVYERYIMYPSKVLVAHTPQFTVLHSCNIWSTAIWGGEKVVFV